MRVATAERPIGAAALDVARARRPAVSFGSPGRASRSRRWGRRGMPLRMIGRPLRSRRIPTEPRSSTPPPSAFSPGGDA